MNIRVIKNVLKPLLKTPLHPQWLTAYGSRTLADYINNIGDHQLVLDIGCFNKWPSQLLPANCRYIGLDYFKTATEWYGSVPDVFGDACKLPVKSSSIDVVLLLDVLEHLPSIDTALQEAARVLRPNGKLILQMPFLYPLHDEPRDFCRISRYGFMEFANKHGFSIEAWHAEGAPLETAGLLANIAISKVVFGWMAQKNPAMIFGVLAPVLILLINLIAKGVSRITRRDEFMPYSYQLVMKKIPRTDA